VTYQTITPRTNAFIFPWGGMVWVAGGIDQNGNALSDVWSSGDYGRSWAQSSNSLPGTCSTGTSSAVQLSGQVVLVCAGWLADNKAHGASYTSKNQQTFSSGDSGLATTWATYKSFTGSAGGLNGLMAFTVDYMAVPFDGTGSLVTIGGATSSYTPKNDVYLSTDKVTWTAQAVKAPWTARYGHSTTTDYLHLNLIMVGGCHPSSDVFNDVWQLTFSTAGTALWYPLPQATYTFPARKFASLFVVHDWLFLYGGSQDTTSGSNNSPLDDVWSSADYGTTWNSMSGNGTGVPRFGATAVSVAVGCLL
jgi:hypothetical protein